MTRDQYVKMLKRQVWKYGLSEYARMLGVDRRRLHNEIHNVAPGTVRNDSRILAALGLRRVMVPHYEPIDPSKPPLGSEAPVAESLR